jgi:FkbM family methyltransferase
MSKLAANIVKGIIGRLSGKKKKSSGSRVSWLQEKLLKHEDDVKEKTITLNNISVCYKRPYEVLHTYKDIFENEIYKFSTSSTRPVIIDCGANIGLSVIYFKRLYPTAKLIAFEPDPGIFELLEKNIRLNNLQDVELHQSAVWTENGSISFSANSTEASHISENADPTTAQQVKTERLADFLSLAEKIDFLKVDIEGAEWKVMLDCARHLSKIQNMFIEYHGKAHETNKLADLLQLFQQHNFSTYIKNAADTLDYPFINKTTNSVYDVQLNIFCYKTNN